MIELPFCNQQIDIEIHTMNQLEIYLYYQKIPRFTIDENVLRGV